MWVRHQGLHSFDRRSKSFWRGIYLPCFTWPCSFLFFTRFSLRRRLCWRWWCIDGRRRSEQRWQWTLDERWRWWRISCSIHECPWYDASFSRLDAALSDDQQANWISSGSMNFYPFPKMASSWLQMTGLLHVCTSQRIAKQITPKSCGAKASKRESGGIVGSSAHLGQTRRHPYWRC